MSEAKLLEARELIIKGDYEAARILLQSIDHPQARALLEMLASQEKSTRFTAIESPPRLPKSAPPSRERQSKLEALKRRLNREDVSEEDFPEESTHFTALESDEPEDAEPEG